MFGGWLKIQSGLPEGEPDNGTGNRCRADFVSHHVKAFGALDCNLVAAEQEVAAEINRQATAAAELDALPQIAEVDAASNASIPGQGGIHHLDENQLSR